MCYYTYCYYATCKHQETVLHRFCRRAKPVIPSATAGVSLSPEASTNNTQSKPLKKDGKVRISRSNKRKYDQWKARKRAQQLQREQMKSAASAHPVTKHQHQHNTASSATFATDTGTASITTEPVLQASSIASSSLQQTQAPEFSTVQPDTMSGLAAFNLRGWISGSSVKPEQQTSRSTEKVSGPPFRSDLQQSQANHSPSYKIDQQPPHQAPDNFRHKEPGIRGTDESWELPNR